MNNNELLLTYVGMGEFNTPAYKDQNGKVWLDINLGHGEPALCSSSNNEVDGEPDQPISGSYRIVEAYKENPYAFQYSMLDRLISDCKYCIHAAQQTGKLYPGHLYYKDVEEHIGEMKKLYESFPESEKPQWCSMEEILGYEKEMINMMND